MLADTLLCLNVEDYRGGLCSGVNVSQKFIPSIRMPFEELIEVRFSWFYDQKTFVCAV